MLWSLMRTHQERAELARRMAAKEAADRRPELAKQLEQRASEYEEDAEVVRRLIEERGETIEVAGEQGSLCLKKN